MNHISLLKSYPTDHKNHVVFEGELFRDEHQNLRYYSCAWSECHCRLVVQGDWFKQSGEHSQHDKSKVIIYVMKQIALGMRSENKFLEKRRIYHDSLTKVVKMFGHEAYKFVLEKDSFDDFMYNAHQKALPCDPKTRANIVLIEELCKTKDEYDFLFFDDGTDDRIIAFAHPLLLPKLCQANTVLMDGTFYTCPKMFAQLYTIHADVGGFVTPVIFAFLTNKLKKTYKRFLNCVKDAC